MSNTTINILVKPPGFFFQGGSHSDSDDELLSVEEHTYSENEFDKMFSGGKDDNDNIEFNDFFTDNTDEVTDNDIYNVFDNVFNGGSGDVKDAADILDIALLLSDGKKVNDNDDIIVDYDLAHTLYMRR